MTIKVTLYGELADFGHEWDIDVHSPIEAIRAINANHPGFTARVQRGKHAFITCPKGEGLAEDNLHVIPADEIELPISNKLDLHIIPRPEGDAKTAFVVIASGLTDAGVAAGLATVIAAAVVVAAYVVVMVGVSKLLMPAPPGMDSGDDAPPSFYFSGPVNTARQGACVPVLYGGPLLVGSQVIGQAVVAEKLSGSATDLQSTAHSEILDAISEGEIRGYAGASLRNSIYLDGTPLEADGIDLFEGFEADYRLGTSDQSMKNLNLSIMPGTSSVTSVGTLIRYSTGGLTETTSDPNVGRVEVTLNVPRLMRLDDDGDVESTSVTIRISVRASGQANFTTAKHVTITGRAQAGYYETVSLPIGDFGSAPYQIRCERVHPDSTDPKITNEVYWTSMTEYVVSNFSYPHTAFAAVSIDAEKFSAVPLRGYLMYGLKVKVPNNYDAINRQYTGDWGGQFYTDLYWTNNPAWIYHDLATNPRYGLGRYLTEDLIDKWALYEIAQYCDEQVADGRGGTEPRFACNLYLQNKGEAFAVLKDLASAFRSIQYWKDSQLTLSQDAPATVYMQFTPANVIEGAFNYSGTPKHKRFTAALVTWINPENLYEAEVEYVEDRYGIQLYGLIETSFTAVGCTSRGQARRAGKYALLTSRLSTDGVTFKAGLDASSLSPGHVIKVVDPLHNQGGESVGGRLKPVTDLGEVTLDRPVALATGETYQISITMVDGSMQVRTVSNPAGTVTPPDVIVFSPNLPSTPVDGAVWSITANSSSEVLYRVMSVAQGTADQDDQLEIVGVRYDSATLTDSDDPGVIEDPDVPDINPNLSAPSGLTLVQGVLPKEVSYRRYIDAFWSPPDAGVVHHYILSITTPNGTIDKYELTLTEYRYFFSTVGTYVFEVYAVNTAGQRSTSISRALTVDAIAPIDLLQITGLELLGQGNDTNFIGRSPEFSWRLTSVITGDLGDETFGGDTGIVDPWFSDYEVKIYNEDGTLRRTDHTPYRGYTYSYERNVEDGGTEGPARTFEISVAARDIFNRTTVESFLEVTNPPSVDYINITTRAGIDLIIITFTPPSDPDFLHTRVYVSTQTGFTPDETTLAATDASSIITVNDLPGINYYVRLEGVDAFGPSGIYTQEFHVVIVTVDRIRDALVGEIQESWLYNDLNQRINLIDDPASGLVVQVGNNTADITTIMETGFTGISSYRQPTDPQLGVPNEGDPAPTLIPGDLWIDTDAGDTMLRWDGDSWEPLASSGSTVYYGTGAPTPTVPNQALLNPGDYYIDIEDTGDGPVNIPYLWVGDMWINVSHGLLNAHAEDIFQLNAAVDDPLTGTRSLAAYLRTVNAEVFIAGGFVQSTIGRVDQLFVELEDPANGTLGLTVYLNDLDLQITSIEGQIETQGTEITTLQSDLTYTIRSFFQPSNDPPITPRDGDLWFKTDLNNQQFRYNALLDAWQSVQDGSALGTSTYTGEGAPVDDPDFYRTGDTYIDTLNGNAMWWFNGTTWEEVTPQAGLQVFYQENPPDAAVSSVGDLWYKPSDLSVAYIYRAPPTGWILATIAGTGITTYVADGVPADNPLQYEDGDLYFDSLDSNRAYRFDGNIGQWVLVDGTYIHTFYQDEPPGDPVSYAGDLWFDTNDSNKIYRYIGPGTGWVPVTDGTAGVETYTGSGAPVFQDFYKIGDLYFDTSDAMHPWRFNGTGWDSVRDAATTGVTTYIGTGDPLPGPYIEGDLYFDTDRGFWPWRYSSINGWESIKDSASVGIHSFYQDVEPAANVSEIGDLWFETDEGNRVWYYTGTQGGWVIVTDQSTQGVVPIYATDPPPGTDWATGDIWIETDNFNHPYWWDGDSWESLLDNPPEIRMTAAVAVEQATRIYNDGLAFAEYTIKVDVNGHIAGIGLSVLGSASGGIRSNVVILADSFAIGLPTTPWLPSVTLFVDNWITPTEDFINANGNVVLLSDGTIGRKWPWVYRVMAPGNAPGTEPDWSTIEGQVFLHGTATLRTYPVEETVPFVTGNVITNLEEVEAGQPAVTRPGVVMSAAAIEFASIDGAHIKNATITNGHLVDVSFDKLTGGIIDVGEGGAIYLGGANFELNSDDNRLTVWDDAHSVKRVELGRLDNATGDTGIIIRNPTGATVLSTITGAYVNGTYIGQGTIGSASIKDSIQSANYQGPGTQGFELKVNNATGAGSAIFNELSVYSGGELILHSGSTAGDLVKAGSGVNIVPGDYANFQNPYTKLFSVQGTASILTTFGYFKGSSLSITSTTTAASKTWMAASATDNPIKLTPGKKWIISFWVYQMGYTASILPSLATALETDYNTGAAWLAPSSTFTWERVSTVIDMTGHGDVREAAVMLYVNSSSESHTTRIDGLMVEEQLGSAEYPSAYYADTFAGGSGGANMIWNSLGYPYNEGWTYGENAPDPANWYWRQRDIVNDPDGLWWFPPGCMEVEQASGTTTGYAIVVSDMVPIDNTKRYQVSGLSGAHRCSVAFGVQFFDIDEAYISGTEIGTSLNNNSKQGGPLLSGWYEHARFIEPEEIPVNAAFMRVKFTKNATIAGAIPATSHMFATHAFICEVSENQREFVPYSPAPAALDPEHGLTAANKSTYIKEAIIDSADIVVAGIETANIAVGNIDTLRVGGNAINVSNYAVLPDPYIDENGTNGTFILYCSLGSIYLEEVQITVAGQMEGDISTGNFTLNVVRTTGGVPVTLGAISSVPGDTGQSGSSAIWRGTHFVLDTAPTAGSVTYALQLVATGYARVGSARMWVTGAKR